MSGLISVGVVGAGAMGAGIAQVAAAAGHEVLLYDVRDGAAAKTAGQVQAIFARLSAKGKMSTDAAQAASARLRPAARLDELAPSGLVIEAIVEDLDAKRRLFASLDQLVSAECLLATNTSSLSLAAIATAVRSPARLVGMHFFNPAPLMDLVEIVGGVATDAMMLSYAEEIARKWGKTTVRARATPGFIVNRVARPFYAEGLRLVAEQAAAPATIDALLRDAGGFRMGPLELTDLIGHDVNFAVTKTVFESFFGDPRFMPSLLQQELVEAGWLGRKSGRGFYDYREGATAPQPQTAPPAPAPDRINLIGHGSLTEALAARLGSAGLTVVREPHLPTDIVLRVSDGRCAAEFDQTTAVVDLALDYATAKRLAVAFGPHCGAAPRRDVIGALQAAGFAVSVLADLPALAVLRTVAMLINEASDAVHFGIASPADIDLAMRKGVNYPLGPLAWCERLTPTYIRHVLERLQRFYGEDRYRVSPRLRMTP